MPSMIPAKVLKRKKKEAFEDKGKDKNPNPFNP